MKRRNEREGAVAADTMMSILFGMLLNLKLYTKVSILNFSKTGF